MYRNVGNDLFQITQSLRETQELLLSHVKNLERNNEELRKDLARRENINAILAEEIREQQATIDRLEKEKMKLPSLEQAENWQLILKRYQKEISKLEEEVKGTPTPDGKVTFKIKNERVQ